MAFKALIFDFDGLILDTETPEVVVWEKIYSDHGLDFPLDSWSTIIGGDGSSTFDAAAHLAGAVAGAVGADSLRRQHRTLSDALTLTQPLLPGVMGALDQARRLGLRLAVASSSPHAWVDSHLGRLRLRDRFEVVVCSDDVPPGRVKPNPELFLKALEMLKIPADQAIALEDSPNGVRAARAAGVYTIAIPNPVTHGLVFDGENLRLSSLSELRLGELVSGLVERR